MLWFIKYTEICGLIKLRYFKIKEIKDLIFLTNLKNLSKNLWLIMRKSIKAFLSTHYNVINLGQKFPISSGFPASKRSQRRKPKLSHVLTCFESFRMLREKTFYALWGARVVCVFESWIMRRSHETRLIFLTMWKGRKKSFRLVRFESPNKIKWKSSSPESGSKSLFNFLWGKLFNYSLNRLKCELKATQILWSCAQGFKDLTRYWLDSQIASIYDRLVI